MSKVESERGIVHCLGCHCPLEVKLHWGEMLSVLFSVFSPGSRLEFSRVDAQWLYICKWMNETDFSLMHEISQPAFLLVPFIEQVHTLICRVHFCNLCACKGEPLTIPRAHHSVSFFYAFFHCLLSLGHALLLFPQQSRNFLSFQLLPRLRLCKADNPFSQFIIPPSVLLWNFVRYHTLW